MADISQITLPNGVTYDIKDTVARNMISGGVSFIIAWDGNSTPVPANIPAGVTVTYNGNTYTGTLTANSAESGAFYLVRSSTSVGTQDSYDEYVPVGTAGSKTWEKIGDTQIDLSDVVTDVTLNKGTTTVLGTGTTFGFTNPSVTLTENTATATGRITYVKSLGTQTTTYLSASASGSAVSASGDNVYPITSLGSPNTNTSAIARKGSSKYITLDTTSITGVSGSTTASKVTLDTFQTTATGGGTASTTNTDWLKGISVSGEVLIIGAATMNTQTTNQFIASNVTVPIAASSATTVATGGLSENNTSSGLLGSANTVTFNAVTGYSPTSNKAVLGSATTFSVTDPTVTIASGSSGDVQVVTNRGTVTTRYMSASASGGAVNVTADSETVLTDAGTTLTVTKG